MDDERRRVAETESLFREVNERIAETAARFEIEQADFYCECADPGCAERVPAPLDEYEDVRAEPTRFLLRPGHEHAEVERVVRRRPSFTIVEKVEPAVARLVRRLDPRADAA